MSERRRSSVWEYMAVAYRSAREPRDPLTWIQHPQAVCSPRVLWREMRSPWWPRRPLWARLLWVGGGLLTTAAFAGLGAVLILLVAAPDGPLMTLLRTFGVAALACIAALWLWSLGTLVFIAMRLPDRDMVPLRRVRTAGARPWEPSAAAELLERREFWSETLRHWRSGRLERRHWAVDPRPVLLQMLTSVALAFAMILCVTGLVPFVAFPLICLGAGVANIVGARRLRGSLRARIAAAVEVRACPDCGYSLEGDADRSSDAAALAAWPGPRRCPECGSPWPLVPPPPRLVNAYGDEVGTVFERAMRALGAGVSAAFTPRSGPRG